MADELSINQEKRTLYQGEIKPLNWWGYIKRCLWKVVTIYRRPGQKIYLDREEIKKYSRRYRTNNLDNIKNYEKRKQTLLETYVTENNCESVLDEIGVLSTNVYARSPEEEKIFLYQKFTALVASKEYGRALALKERIYEEYSEDILFRKNLIKALNGIGANKEAAMESYTGGKPRHFLIIPAGKASASGTRRGLIELGIVMRHFGHRVSFILEPAAEAEKYRISKNEFVIDRRENSLGCRQYLQEEVEREGFGRFLGRFQEDELFVITRKRKFLHRLEGKKITYIFPDFTDCRDAESKVGARMPKEDIEYLYKHADVIVTRDADIVQNNREYILWNDNDHKEEYWFEERRWQFGDVDRFSERAISMAEAIHEYLKRKTWGD